MQLINTSLKLMLCKMDKKICLVTHEQSEMISKKNKGESVNLHMATKQCYFEKDIHETLS